VGRNLYGKGIDEILRRAYGAQTYYFQQDQNGNVTQLTNPSGAIVEQYKYDAFGAVTIFDALGNQLPATAYNNRFLFTGREYAATFGFYEYRARAYNPTLGRFMSEDPIGFQIAGEKPSPPASLMFPTQLPKTFEDSEFNLFRYCHNDPVNKSDPMGLYIEYTGGTEKFWENWSEQFSKRWADPVFRTWWNNAAGSRDGYVVGPKGQTGSGNIPAESRLPRTMRRSNNGSSSFERGQRVKDSGQGRGTNITHYGYPNDPTSDRNSRLGLGSCNNILNPDSVALSPDNAKGVPFGGAVEVNGHFIGFYHDLTDSSLRNRVDVYDPSNSFR
jgi:RHS repeat-associated protein